MRILGSYSIILMTSFAAVAACATEAEQDPASLAEEEILAIDEQAISEDDLAAAWAAENPDLAGTRSVDGAETADALCIRTPRGPGKVKWNNRRDGTWRSEVENGKKWVGARYGETQSTDGIHRDGWGCSVYKVPDHCTLTVSGNGSFDCCCNAAASVFEGRCRWVHYSEFAPRPPGC